MAIRKSYGFVGDTGVVCEQCSVSLRPKGLYRKGNHLYKRYQCPICLNATISNTPTSEISIQNGIMKITCLVCKTEFETPFTTPMKRNSMVCYVCNQNNKSKGD